MTTRYGGFDLSVTFDRGLNCVNYWASSGSYILIDNDDFKNPDSLIGTDGHPYTVKEYIKELKREIDYFNSHRDKYYDVPYDF